MIADKEDISSSQPTRLDNNGIFIQKAGWEDVLPNWVQKICFGKAPLQKHTDALSLDLLPPPIQQPTKIIPKASPSTEKTTTQATQTSLITHRHDPKLLKSNLYLSSAPPSFLVKLYIQVWRTKKKAEGLSMSELLSRPVDPESPRWFFLPIRKNSTRSRIQCWSYILQELQEHLSKTPQKRNIYGFHNAAVLSFLIYEHDSAFRIMDTLLETTFHPVLLKTTGYFYIQTKQHKNAAAVLCHLLRRDASDGHALYLSMKLLSRFEEGMEDKNRGELEAFRSCVMKYLCKRNPRNHLYKIWYMYWENLRGDNRRDMDSPFIEELSEEEVIENTMDFLMQVIGEENEKNEILPINASRFTRVRHWCRSLFKSNSIRIFINIIGLIVLIIGISYLSRWLRRWLRSMRRRFRRKVKRNPLHDNDKYYYREFPKLPKQSDEKNTKKPYKVTFTPQDEESLKTSSHFAKVVMKSSEKPKKADSTTLTSKDFKDIDRLYKEIKQHTSKEVLKDTALYTPPAPKKKTTSNTENIPVVISMTGGREAVQRVLQATDTREPVSSNVIRNRRNNDNTTTTNQNRTGLNSQTRTFGARNRLNQNQLQNVGMNTRMGSYTGRNFGGDRFGRNGNMGSNRFGGSNFGNRFGGNNMGGNRFGGSNMGGNRFGGSNMGGNRFGATRNDRTSTFINRIQQQNAF